MVRFKGEERKDVKREISNSFKEITQGNDDGGSDKSGINTLSNVNNNKLMSTSERVEKLIEDEKLTHEPEILSKESLTNDNSKWVGLYKITYLDQNGKKRFWESVERKTRTTNEIDAVGIVPLLKSKDSNTTKTILCIQFRPSTGKKCVEFPAGLVEKDEAPEQAALRELYEETGYTGKAITNVSTSMFNDAGITNTNMKLVFIEVDLDDEINKNPIPKLEEDEFINILLVDLKDLYSTLQEYDKKGYGIDARLASFALGLIINDHK
nr:6132_t:CDS:2 [Entrophospora candida]